MPSPSARLGALGLALLLAGAAGSARVPRQPRLAPADIDLVVELVTLEDQRRFDQDVLTRALQSAHPEVRRRAVVATGRIVDPRGRTLLHPLRSDADENVVATVAFAAGQLKDADAVGWLGTQLSGPSTPRAIAQEAARSLGKIRTAEARAALSKYLTAAPSARSAWPVVGEALLASGRFPTTAESKTDVTPIVRWIDAPDDEVRWRAAWALFRVRDAAAIPALLRLATDRSADVRYWAVRGLAASVVDSSSVSRATAAATLRTAARDRDRRVRTEAVRALGQYDDDESFGFVLAALDSPDSWLSVSAAESLGRAQARATIVAPKLAEATGLARPTSLRITALTPLITLAPDRAVNAAAALISSPSSTARAAAVSALRRLGPAGAAMLDTIASDPATRALVPPAPAGRGARPPRPVLTAADYRRLVTRWIVPDYEGATRPRTVWETPRGRIEIELYPGDAPFGVEYLLKVVESGAIVGTEFSRVVPNFVAQQQAIADDAPLRDEVSRIGLSRGNLSWASAGLDTGRPGYTLATAPHPHIEGDFTALGRVVDGLDVIDRLELGDRVTGARIKR